MTIRNFQFLNSNNNWSLSEVSFEKLNLLVGLSGVGKTRIIKALRATRKAALDNVDRLGGCSWTMEIQADSDIYIWDAKVIHSLSDSLPEITLDESHDEANSDERTKSSKTIIETITRSDGEKIIERSESEFVFMGVKLPKLKNNESGITLLRAEDSVKPVHQALRKFIFSEAGELPSLRFIPLNNEFLSTLCKKFHTLELLRNATDMPLVLKAYLLQERFPDEFNKVKELYSDIFSTVTDIKISTLKRFDDIVESSFEIIPTTDLLSIAVKEDGVTGWISSDRLSSGMHRTLVHLIELVLAPEGTIIVIDEFENSLGVNCLPQIAALMLERTTELQFILTSHHPYVINNIPTEHWKIVKRHGSQIDVCNANDIEALKTNSAQDKFIQLLNLDEYQEGVQ